MARKTCSTKIGGRTFTLRKLNPFAAAELAQSLADIIADGAGKVLGSGASLESILSAEVSSMGSAFTSLLRGVSNADIRALSERVLLDAEMDGRPLWPVIEDELDLAELVHLLWFGVEANLGGFFEDLARRATGQLSLLKASQSGASATSAMGSSPGGSGSLGA